MYLETSPAVIIYVTVRQKIVLGFAYHWVKQMTSDNPCDWTSCAYDGKASGHSKARKALIYEYSCGLVAETPVLSSISGNSHSAELHVNLDNYIFPLAFFVVQCFVDSPVVTVCNVEMITNVKKKIKAKD